MDSFERYMFTEHKGNGNAVTSKEIELRFHCRGSEVRRIVNDLRCRGIPICSCSKGYFYATNADEIQGTITHLEGRKNKLVAAQNGLKNHLKDKRMKKKNDT